MIKDAILIKEKIMQTLAQRGPSLPIHIAKATEQPTLFASAFLSELFSEKRIRISNMKVGGSPLYLLPGQEPLLEKFQDFIKGKEKEALIMLKEQKIIESKTADPAIRVALQYLRDFAFLFQYDGQQYWRYYLTSEEEAKNIIKMQREIFQDIIKTNQELQQVIQKQVQDQPIQSIEEIKIESQPLQIQAYPIKNKERKIEKENEKSIEKPLLKTKQSFNHQVGFLGAQDSNTSLKNLDIKEKETSKSKIKEKSEFVVRVVNYLMKEKIELIEEKDFKKKEFYGICSVASHLGKIEFFIIGKDKKRLNEDDLTIAVQQSHAHNMPVLILSSGDIDKKAQPYLEIHKNIIKFRKI